MLNEIIKKYEKFSDALISTISYETSGNRKEVEVTIKCMNSLDDYKWETIKLIFTEILSIRFVENERTSSTLINSALIKKVNDILIFDFFPMIFGASDLRENKNSDFKIKCKEIKYEILKPSH